MLSGDRPRESSSMRNGVASGAAHPFQFFHKCCALETQKLGGFVAIAPRTVERALYEIPLDGQQVARQVEAIFWKFGDRYR